PAGPSTHHAARSGPRRAARARGAGAVAGSRARRPSRPAGAWGRSLPCGNLAPRMWRLQLPDGRSLPLRALPATLGRDDAASVRVRHASIAPLHARLRAAPDGRRLIVEAVGEALVRTAGHAVRVVALDDGDTLELGELSFTVRREASALAP